MCHKSWCRVVVPAYFRDAANVECAAASCCEQREVRLCAKTAPLLHHSHCFAVSLTYFPLSIVCISLSRARTRAHTSAHSHKLSHTHTDAYMQTHTYIHKHTYTRTHSHAHTHAPHIQAHTHIRTHVQTYVHIHTLTRAHTLTHTRTHTNTQRQMVRICQHCGGRSVQHAHTLTLT